MARKKAGLNHKKRTKRTKRSWKRLGMGSWARRQKAKHGNRGRSKSTV